MEEEQVLEARGVALPCVGRGPMSLASIRQSIYQRSLPLSTRHLEILYAPLGDRAGVIGCAAMALQETMRGRGVLPDPQTGALP